MVFTILATQGALAVSIQSFLSSTKSVHASTAMQCAGDEDACVRKLYAWADKNSGDEGGAVKGGGTYEDCDEDFGDEGGAVKGGGNGDGAAKGGCNGDEGDSFNFDVLD